MVAGAMRSGWRLSDGTKDILIVILYVGGKSLPCWMSLDMNLLKCMIEVAGGDNLASVPC